ncbi:MAG: hypothetical protein KF770_00885 [Anaerolineae bacterium]|nr:hypothetical protein [Anaerolineae bacterium]
MEEEIDLRPYIEAVVKRWYWIVGVAVLAAIVAFIVTSFSPPVYEATALVAVVAPRDVVQLDLRIRETTTTQPLRAFPQLALSDQVLQTLLEQRPIAGVDTVQELRSRLGAEAGDDTSIIQLTATSQKPEEAAALVNAWAAVFVNWANEVYTGQSSQQVSFFEEQLVAAEAELRTAEEALITFQAINRTEIISNTLAAYAITQSEYLTAQRRNGQLTRQVQELRDQLATANTQPVTLADQLTALSLQLQAFGAETAVPIQLQVADSATLTTASRNEQLALLDSLLATLAAQARQIEAELAAIEPYMLALQQQREEANTEYNRLLRNQTVTESAYMALAHKVEEKRITSQDTSSGVRLASQAGVPTSPANSSRLLILGAAILGGVLTTAVLLGLVWWQQLEITRPSDDGQAN